MAGRLSLVVAGGAGGVAIVPLVWERDELVLGRDDDCDICLGDPGASPRHARLTRDPATGATLVADLESEGGTTIEGRRLLPLRPTPLARGAALRIGGTVLALAERRAPWLPHRALSAEAFERRVEAEVARASAEGSTFALVEIRVGAPTVGVGHDLRHAAHHAFARAFFDDDAIVSLEEGVWRVLVPRAAPAEVRPLLGRLRVLFDGAWRRSSARWAFFPRDGVTGKALALALDDVAEGPTELRRPPASGPGLWPKLDPAAERVAAGDGDVLIVGEAGVGKELLARALHERSPRAGRRFVRVDGGACPGAGLERELFGHETGPYRGPWPIYPGLLETVGDGTLYIDEPSALPPPLQAKLARVLETREAARLNGFEARPVKARFVFAMRSEPGAEVVQGRLLPELGDRIGTAAISVPPLRERKGELGAVVEALIAGACGAAGRPVAPRVSPRALALLEAYRWPGNLRELGAVLESALARCDGPTVTPEHLPLEHLCDPIAPPAAPRRVCRLRRPESGGYYAEAEEGARLVEALAQSSGNVMRAAKMLSADPRTMAVLLKKHGLFDL